APMQNHQISYSGGNENINYYISGNYFSQEGIMLGSDIERGSGRINIEAKVNERIKVGTNFSYSHTQSKLGQVEDDRVLSSAGLMLSTLYMSPHYGTERNQD